MAEVLTEEQIADYDANGYLLLEGRIPADVMDRVRAEIARLSEPALTMTASDDRLDLEDTHTPEMPRIRRIKLPHKQSDVMRNLMLSDHILAPVRDLIGPDLRLHTSKLNMKSASYGAAVEWHQDWAFYPQTNDDVLAVGVLVDDMEFENGPLMVFPGTHKGPVFDHHHDGVFAGAMDLGAAGLDISNAVALSGPAGSISIHHARVVHGSALNTSSRDRRVMFFEMMAADCFPIFGNVGMPVDLEDLHGRQLCGQTTLEPRLRPAPVRVPLPQPVSAGSIYEIQKSMGARAFDVVE